jgi:hypothetical protein
MELRPISVAAVFAATIAIGFSACAPSSEDTAAADESQGVAGDQQKAKVSGSDSSSANQGSTNKSSGVDGSESDSKSSSESSQGPSTGDGDASALEDADMGDAGSLEGSNGGQDTSGSDKSGPQISLVSKRCNGGKLLTQWRITDSSGVATAAVYRYNEYNATIDTAAHWMGPQTGDGNQWTSTSAGGLNLKESVSIAATDKNGNTSQSGTTAPAGC